MHHQTKQIVFQSTLNNYRKYLKHNNSSADIERFLHNMSVTDNNWTGRNLTWLELYILYRTRGHPKPIRDPKKLSHARATLDKQVIAFKNTLRGTANRIIKYEDGINPFKPTKAIKDQLAGIGILGKHQGPQCNISITTGEQMIIAKWLHTLNHSCNNNKICDIVEGKCGFVPKKTQAQRQNKMGRKHTHYWRCTCPEKTAVC